MIVFAGLNNGQVYGIRDLVRDNFDIETEWNWKHAKPAFTVVIDPYVFIYNTWINNADGDDFYEYEASNSVISRWNNYYKKNRSNVVRIEDLYTMDGQMQFIMKLSKRYSFKLGLYKNRILWYGRKIKVMEDKLSNQQSAYITSLIDKEIVNRYGYHAR